MTCLATCGILFVLLLILPVFENILQYLQFAFVHAFNLFLGSLLFQFFFHNFSWTIFTWKVLFC